MNYPALKEFFLNPEQGNESVYRDFEIHVRNRVKRKLSTMAKCDTEDLVSEICWQCCRATLKHNPEYPFEHYLNRIISNMIAKAIGKKCKNNEVALNEEFYKMEVTDQFKEIGADEIENEIIKIIHSLKNKDEEIILLILQCLSNAEIAERLNEKKGTIATRRFRALKNLKCELEKVGIYI